MGERVRHAASLVPEAAVPGHGRSGRHRYPPPVTSPQRAPGGFPVVGIIGGGQLARMCAGPAAELAITLSVLAECDRRGGGPGHPLGTGGRPQRPRGGPGLRPRVRRRHVRPRARAAGRARGPRGRRRRAAPQPARRCASPRTSSPCAQRLTEIGVACPAWARHALPPTSTSSPSRSAGPSSPRRPEAATTARGCASSPPPTSSTTGSSRRRRRRGGRLLADGLLLEEKVDFVRELAVLIARSPSDQAAAWPVVETVQTDGICTEVLAPAPGPRPATWPRSPPRPGCASPRSSA